MFESFKKILLGELLEQVEYADRVHDEMVDIEHKLNTFVKPDEEFLIEPIDPSVRYSKNNIFFKLFLVRSHKKEVKEYELKKAEYDRKKEEQEKALKEYTEIKDELENRLKELKTIWENNDLDGIKKKYEKIKSASNFMELGYNFEQIKEIFSKNNIPLVLNDISIPNNESSFDKLEDFVLVHKTKYVPTNNEIKTTANSNATYDRQIIIGDEVVDINYKVIRNTVHFAVNGEVGSHFYGQWDGLKYAVIIPFMDVPNIVNFSTGDTYTNGNVDISKGYLLCPVDEVEEIKSKNPNVTVVGYRGKSVDGIANQFVKILGYKYEGVGTHGWQNKDDEAALRTISSKTTLRLGGHAGTIESFEESEYTSVSLLKALIEKMLEKRMQYDLVGAADDLMGLGKNRGFQLGFTNRLFTLHDGEFFKNFVEELKNYGIVIPSYIFRLRDAENNNKVNLDKTDFIPSDVKDYLEKYNLGLKSGNLNRRHGLDFTEKAFVYELLKQVKKINKEKIKEQETGRSLN